MTRQLPLVFSFVLAGCIAAPDDISIAADEQAVEAIGTCPDTASDFPAVELQQRATAAFRYVLGAPAPTYACRDGAPLSADRSGLDALRVAVADGVCSLAAAETATVCGLAAGVHRLSCSSLTSREKTTIKHIPAWLDACWGSGASGFFNVGGVTETFAGSGTWDLEMAIDPEPASLTWWPLGGGNGMTAAAYYINSLDETIAVRWTSSWAYNPSLAAGTPCSTVDLAAWSGVVSTVQAIGDYRKCL